MIKQNHISFLPLIVTIHIDRSVQTLSLSTTHVLGDAPLAFVCPGVSPNMPSLPCLAARMDVSTFLKSPAIPQAELIAPSPKPKASATVLI